MAPLVAGATRRSLPDGKAISALGFGCSSLWAKPSFDAEEAQAILETAERAGINHFDTGPSYGDGERRLGRFLQARDLSRLVVSTKVGTHPLPDGGMSRSFDPGDIRRSFDESLRRLGVDRVDILYLHGPSAADLSLPVLQFFDEEKRRGRIAYSGVNSFDPAVLEATLATPIDAVMLQYSAVDLRCEPLIERLHGRGKTVIAGTILGQSVYDLRTFLPTSAKALWYLARALKNDPLFALKGRRFAQRAAKLALPPQDAAIRFAVNHPLLTSCLFGTTRAAHVTANMAAAGQPMTLRERDFLVGRIPNP
ncbi:MAG TPA: aldo/keto reductase [Alphaproteobacteria bacterium]|jgi:aryl-alcohol dehydrogenase-like predicted oxidoreductase